MMPPPRRNPYHAGKQRSASFNLAINRWSSHSARADNRPVDEDRAYAAKEPADDAMAHLVSGVGQVCISASALEWALTYLTGVISVWEDSEYARVLGKPGQPLKEYQQLASRLQVFGLGPEPGRLAADAERLLGQRHRVVHSVMLAEGRRDSTSAYGAWHPRADVTWPVVAADLRTLASDLALCAAEATGFAQAWQERAERDGWPDLSALPG
jgi:hypothetical protein